MILHMKKKEEKHFYTENFWKQPTDVMIISPLRIVYWSLWKLLSCN